MEKAWTPAEKSGQEVEHSSSLGYVPELDGLRGVAILFVMASHAPLGRYHSLFPGGFIGVDIFFVLSGFLITTLLVQEFDRTGSVSLRNFYIRRALRLGPALLALLAAICVGSFLLFDHERARRNSVDALVTLFYVSNWVRVFTQRQLGLLAHSWSLSAEEQFYIIWPIILLMLLRRSKDRSQVVSVAASLAVLSWLTGVVLTMNGASPRHLCFGLDARADTLMVGCVLGLVLSSGLMPDSARKNAQKLLPIAAPLALACLVAFSVFCHSVDRSFFYYGFFVIALLAAVLILDVFINPRSMVRKILTMKWLVWVGSISYGLYLWHWPIY